MEKEIIGPLFSMFFGLYIVISLWFFRISSAFVVRVFVCL